MFKFLKSSKTKEKDVNNLYNIIYNNNIKLSEKQIENIILEKGYSRKVTSKVIKKLKSNNYLFLNIDSKDEILKEMSSTINSKKKENISTTKPKDIIKTNNVKPKKITKPKNLKDISKQKKSFFTNILFNLKKLYFFFEDKYYDFVDWVSKTVPLNKLTDKIDKKFPSFVAFIMLLVVIVLLLVFLIPSSGKLYNINVSVMDSSGAMLKDTNITLIDNNSNLKTMQTDVFGEVKFENIKLSKNSLLKVVKDDYIPKTKNLDLSNRNIIEQITLDLDQIHLLLDGNTSPQTRTISFLDNDVLITSPLTVNFYCSNSQKTPDPNYKIVNAGMVIVNQPAGCGDLRVSVSSNKYKSITNQIVSADNKINLIKNNNDKGQLTVYVKDIYNLPIRDASIKVYVVDNPTTNIDESQIVVSNKTTDIYGRYLFNLYPGNYLVSVSKPGFLVTPKQGPYNVVLNSNKTINFKLLTVADLDNLDCSNNDFADFCIDGQLDCNNEIIKNYVSLNSNGECIVGKPGYLNVSLIDSNSSVPVTGSISLYSKPKDSNQPFSDTSSTFNNTSSAHFDVLNIYDYQIRVFNTEENGYLVPDPVDVNDIDKNIVIPIEYSSSLNSGDINVSVTDNHDFGINNTSVYLFKEVNDDFILVNNIPKITNINGLVNFNSQRANRKYYAYAVQSYENLEGSSSTKRLDVNKTLKLDVQLQHIPSILNLYVNASDYNISFYNLQNELIINDYVVMDVAGTDHNKEYVFSNGEYKVYAIIKANGYASYQTDIIHLSNFKKIYKKVTLSVLSSCSDIKLDFLGLYNESGDTEVSKIDFVNNKLNDEYKLKFRYTSCSENPDLRYAFIRTGERHLVKDDPIYITGDSINQNEIVRKYGYAFAGELTDWNRSFFEDNYEFDHTYSSGSNKYKWVEISFKDYNIQEVEFSINIKFTETIEDSSNYTVNYRALLNKSSEFNFNPSFSGANNWSIVPNGYFYAKSNNFVIPFEYTDCVYNYNIYDSSMHKQEMNGDAYSLLIDNNYFYKTNFLYLKDTNTSGDYNLNYINSDNYLIFKKYTYKDTNMSNSKTVNVNYPGYSINNLFATKGYSLDVSSLMTPTNFFSTTNVPKINNKIFDLINNNVNVYSYREGNGVNTIITTQDITGNDNIFIGDNNVSFKVVDNSGQPISDINVSYKPQGGNPIIIGSTDASGVISNYGLSFPIILLNKNVNFIFAFPSSYGFENNEIVVSKKIISGYNISTTQPITYVATITEDNNIKTVDLDSNSYVISKYTSNKPVLDYINIIPLDNTNYFNILSTNNNLNTDNSLPKSLTHKDTTITATIDLNLDSINSNAFTKIQFRNKLLVGKYNTEKVYEFFDVNADLNIIYKQDLIFDVNTEPLGIYKIDNNVNVELVENIFPSVIVDYNISKPQRYTNNVVKINNVLARGFNSSIYLNTLNSWLSRYKNKKVTLNGIDLNVPIKMLKNAETKSGKVYLDFNISIDGVSEVYTKEINVKLFNSTNTITINQDNVPQIYCVSKDKCDSNTSYSFTNNTKSLGKISLTSIDSQDKSGNQISLNHIYPDLPKDINLQNFNLDFDSNYDYLVQNPSSNYIIDNNQNIKFTFKFNEIKEKTFDVNNDLLLDILLVTDVSNSEFNDDFCLGVGGQVDQDHVFILGRCLQTQEELKTGNDALPNIIYNWGKLDNSNIPWTTECLAKPKNNIYCDSTQLLLTIFKRINDNNFEDFEINLMVDGVSKDLLKDFIEYNSNFAANNVISLENPNLFKSSAVDNGDFNISKKCGGSLDCGKPGVYIVSLNGFENLSTDNLNISLNYVSGVPINDQSVLLYMPFDAPYDGSPNSGSVGMGSSDKNRDGYGMDIEYLSQNDELVPFGENTKLDFNATNTPVYLNLINNTNINSSDDFKNTLRSKGKILEINLNPANDNKFVIDMNYTPSFPVPVYAYDACVNDYNLSYNLLYNNEVQPILFKPFINWDNNGEIVGDSAVYNLNGYTHHSLHINNSDENSVLINSMLYLPASINLQNSVLSLSNLNNSDYSALFGKSNTTNTNWKLLGLQTNVSSQYTYLKSYTGLFDLLKSELVGIHVSSTNVYLKWLPDAINLSNSDIQKINETISSIDPNCDNGNSQNQTIE